jgi:uncharacterized membrane protein required for colicin V production
MGIDIGLLALLAGSTIHGYLQGLVRGTGSLATLAVTVLLALQTCDDLARFFMSNSQVGAPVALVCFAVVLGLEWLALWTGRKLLHRLLARTGHDEVDQFLGGIAGLGRGIAGAWLGLAALVTSCPPALAVVSKSSASMRLLAVSGLPKVVPDLEAEAECSADSADYKCAAMVRGADLRTYAPGN